MPLKTTLAVMLVAGSFAPGQGSTAAARTPEAGAPHAAIESSVQSAPAAQLGDGVELEDFIRMVSLIVTRQEVQAWNAAASDEERSALVSKFWEDRDPTPGTSENEFRDLYLRRVNSANRKFGDEGIPGYRTDRGQFVLIYGEDAILEQERRRVSADPAAAGESPTRYRVTWVLDPAINPFLEGREEVGFEQREGRYIQDDPKVTLSQDALMAHRDLQALFGLLRAGSQAAPPRTGTGGAAAVMPGSGEAPTTTLSTPGEAMRQLIDEGIERHELGLRFEAAYFPAPESNTYMVLAFKVDKEALTFGGVPAAGGAPPATVLSGRQIGSGAGEEEQPPAALHAFGFLLTDGPGGQPQLVRQLLMEFLVDPDEGRGGASRTYSFGMTLVPGSYRLAWGVMDDVSELLTTLDTPLEVPNFATGDLTLTSVLVAKPPMLEQTEPIDIDKVYEGVRIGNIQLDVDIDRHFERDDTIELLYFVMGAGIDPISQQTQLEVEHTLLRAEGEEVIARLPTQTLNYFAIGQQIPLGQVGQIEPGGSYQIRIEIKDVVSEAELTYEVPFTIAVNGPAQ